jgi:hypothetical protein
VKLTDRLRGEIADICFHTHRFQPAFQSMVAGVAKKHIYQMRSQVTNCIQYSVRNVIQNGISRISQGK